MFATTTTATKGPFIVAYVVSGSPSCHHSIFSTHPSGFARRTSSPVSLLSFFPHIVSPSSSPSATSNISQNFSFISSIYFPFRAANASSSSRPFHTSTFQRAREIASLIDEEAMQNWYHRRKHRRSQPQSQPQQQEKTLRLETTAECFYSLHRPLTLRSGFAPTYHLPLKYTPRDPNSSKKKYSNKRLSLEAAWWEPISSDKIRATDTLLVELERCFPLLQACPPSSSSTLSNSPDYLQNQTAPTSIKRMKKNLRARRPSLPTPRAQWSSQKHEEKSSIASRLSYATMSTTATIAPSSLLSTKVSKGKACHSLLIDNATTMPRQGSSAVALYTTVSQLKQKAPTLEATSVVRKRRLKMKKHKYKKLRKRTRALRKKLGK